MRSATNLAIKFLLFRNSIPKYKSVFSLVASGTHFSWCTRPFAREASQGFVTIAKCTETISVMFWAPAAPWDPRWHPWQLHASCLQTHGTQRVRDQEKSISYIVYQGMLSAAAGLVARVWIYRDMSTKMNGTIVLSMIDRSSDANMSFKHYSPSFCSPMAAVPDP